MKYFVVALCVFAVAAASSDQQPLVLRSNSEQFPEGNFNYGFEIDNGIKGQASGVVKSIGKDEIALEITGTNEYKSPEGDTIALTYIANENGYQPQGAHLPTPPAPEPVPEYILRALEYIKTHPYVEKKL